MNCFCAGSQIAAAFTCSSQPEICGSIFLTTFAAMKRNVTMRERHGIPDALKMKMFQNNEQQHVTVEDGEGLVLLRLGTSSYPAGMTPDQARMIARQLNSSALRIEKQKRKPGA